MDFARRPDGYSASDEVTWQAACISRPSWCLDTRQRFGAGFGQLTAVRLMNPNPAKTLIFRNVLLCAAAIVVTSCGTATFSKSGSDAEIESLRSFHLAFIDEFAVPGQRFNPTAFDVKVNQGNAQFQQAIADEKFTARRPALIDLKAQFDADVTHLRSKASRGKVTPALATEMKKDVNKIYDHVLGR